MQNVAMTEQEKVERIGKMTKWMMLLVMTAGTAVLTGCRLGQPQPVDAAANKRAFIRNHVCHEDYRWPTTTRFSSYDNKIEVEESGVAYKCEGLTTDVTLLDSELEATHD